MSTATISAHPFRVSSFRTCGAVRRIAVVALVLVGARPYPLPAQAATFHAAAPGSWRVQSAASSDLWFHAMAVIGYEGPGPLPMYDREYTRQVLDAKRRSGVYPTLLDRKATALRNAFYRDSAFEVLHFLPLYFLALDADAFLDAVRAITRQDSRALNALDPTTRNAVTALGSVLTTRRERDVLGDFLDALQEERRVFYDDYERESSRSRGQQITRAEQYWNASLAPALAHYLARSHFRNGLILVSPALGAEGRFVNPRRAEERGAVIAVGLPASALTEYTFALSAVRELCFPLVHEVIERDAGRPENRVAAERLSSVAAVRCGALAVERYSPELSTAYQSQFLRAVGSPSSGVNIDAAFTRAFFLPPAIEASLRRAVASP